MAGFYCESLPALSEPARRRVRFSAGRCFLGYRGAGHAEAMRQFPAIAVMDSNGSDVTRLIGHEFAGEGCGDVLNICGVDSPTWSPDGQQVAFAYWEGYVMSSGVAIINVEGTLRFRRDEDAGAAT